MANTLTIKSDSFEGRYMLLTCTQRKDAQKSYIDWTLSSVGGEVNYYSTGPTAVYINHTNVYYKDRVSWESKVFPAAKGSVSGTLIVEHDANGSKTIAVGLETAIYYGSSSTKRYTSNWTLDSIARGVTILSAPSEFTDQTRPTVTYSNPMGNDVQSLEICITNASGSVVAPYRAVSKTGSSYTFTTSDIEILRQATAGSSLLGGMFVLRATMADGKTYSDKRTFTFSLTQNSSTVPTVSMTLSPDNSSLPSTLSGVYIQGKSKVKATISATAKNGASISSYSVNLEGVNYPSTSNVITTPSPLSSGTISIVGRAVDSRGFTGSVTGEITVTEYSKPLVIPVSTESVILCYRGDSNGKIVGNSTSVYVKVGRTLNTLGGKNGCKLQWRRKLTSEAWSSQSWSNLTTSSEYKGLVSGTFDTDKSYSLQIRAIDDVGEYDVKNLYVPTMDIPLHLGEGGKNVTIGGRCDYSEEYTFRSAWKAIFENRIEGTLINKYAADVLTFAMDCQLGLTPFVTRETSTNLPPEGSYNYSAGIVLKRTDTQINVYLADYFTGEIASNTYLVDKGGWLGWDYNTGWKTLNSFTKYRRKNGHVTVAVWCDGKKTLTQNDYTVVGTLPVGYRPGVKTALVYHTIGGVVAQQSGYIDTNGDICVYTNSEGRSYWAFTVTYPI